MVGQDITPLKQAEAGLKSIINENEKIKETISGILFMFNRENNSTTYLNSKAFNYLTAQDAKLSHDEVFEKLIHPEDLPIIEK